MKVGTMPAAEEKPVFPVESQLRLRKPCGISCHYRRGDCVMIDRKQAVEIARVEAASLLGQGSSSLEEIERDSYKGREIWSITLALPRDVNKLPPFAQLTANPLQYKRFLIDVETGELVAMQLRDVASQQ
jgi:hypothetical protein